VEHSGPPRKDIVVVRRAAVAIAAFVLYGLWCGGVG
jgi:hypothetical protein